MIRTLAHITLASFVLAMASLAGALAIAGGPDGLVDTFVRFAEQAEVRIKIDGEAGEEAGPRITRELAWDGSDTLEIDAFADVTYVQGPAARVTVEGPTKVLDALTLQRGRLAFRGKRWRGSAIHVVVEAPEVRRFELDGVQDLKITAYDQDTLAIHLSGTGRVAAAGRARRATLRISGTGTADLAALELDEAEVDLSGAGRATLGPRTSARIDVSGLGEVELTRRPDRLRQNVSGAGRVKQPALPG